jgi:hypothetical protein
MIIPRLSHRSGQNRSGKHERKELLHGVSSCC